MASIRLQLAPAIKAAQSRKIETEIWSLHSDKIDEQVLMNKHLACIVGKLSARSHLEQSMYIANSAILSRFKDINVPIISIYSDNHARKEGLMGTLYRQILCASSLVVCPTKSLQKAAKQFNNQVKTCVIEDPWQVQDMIGMRERLGECIEILWFGSHMNWKYMKNILTDTWRILEPHGKYTFNVLAANIAIDVIKNNLIKSNPPRNVQIRIIPWSNKDQPNQLQMVLENSDIVLVPSDPDDPAKQGVSHNRVVDAVRAGCIAIASPMPSYKEIEKVALIGDNIPKMLRKVIDNYDSFSANISQSREAVLERFSPDLNAKKWGDVIDRMTKNDLT